MATVADEVIARLGRWGVSRLYGYPGDGINGFLGALARAEGEIRVVQARHEETAAFMACGHAKFTGELGVCLATSGPGAIHLLNGLYDARADGQPVLAVVGQQRRLSLGAGYQQEVDLAALFADVSEFVQTCVVPEQAPHLVDRAVRTALDAGGVSTLIFPNDVQEAEAAEPPRAHGAVFSGVGYARPRVLPPRDELARAAAVLNEGERPAVLVGRGAYGAGRELRLLADALGAGVAKALLGKDVLPDDLPYVTGTIGLLGTRASYELMRECDTLLLVGTSFPYAEWLPEPGRARGVQIDRDGRTIGLRYPMEAHLVGDATATLRELLPLVRPRRHGEWRRRVERWVEESNAEIERRSATTACPLSPERAASAMSEHLPDDTIVCGDSGTTTVWLARNVRLREGMRASVSGGLASMGSAVPYAIAAKTAHPERPVLAVLGDGAFQMNGMNELITVLRYWREWSDPRFVVAVFDNGDLNMVTWEQRALGGDPAFPATQWLPHVSAAGFAELLGLTGIRCDSADGLDDAWRQAWASTVPVVLELPVDPDVPPLPPHVTAEQAWNMGRALVHGDPRAGGVMQKTVLAKLRENRLLGRMLG